MKKIKEILAGGESATTHKGHRNSRLLTALVTLLVYLPALNNGFVNWDDQLYVYDNANIIFLDRAFFKWPSLP